MTLRTNLKSFVFQDFKGLNRSSDRLNSSPEFLYDLLNGYIKKDAKSNLGVITQRDGISKFNSTSIMTEKLLLHFDGDDAATTHTATTGQVVTFVDDAQLDTADKKFGTASLLLDGTGDYITLPDSSDWAFGTAPFSVEAWVKRAAIDSQQFLIHWANGGVANTDVAFAMYWTAENKLVCGVGTTAGVTRSITSTSAYTDTTAWHHVAMTRIGTTLYLFYDGALVGTNIDLGTGEINDLATTLKIGVNWFNTAVGADFFNGWIDEVRIFKGESKSSTTVFTTSGSAYTISGGYGTTTKIRVAYEAKWNAGGTDVIIRAGTAWGKYDNSDSFDTIDGARTDDADGQCAMFKNELIMVDGAKARKMTSAYAVSDLSPADKIKDPVFTGSGLDDLSVDDEDAYTDSADSVFTIEVDGHRLSFDGANDQVDFGDVGSVLHVKIRLKLAIDNQEIMTFRNTTATAVTVTGGVLTFGSELQADNIRIDGVSKTAGEAGTLLNGNVFHTLEFDVRPYDWVATTVYGTASVAYLDGVSYKGLALGSNYKPPNTSYWETISSSGGIYADNLQLGTDSSAFGEIIVQQLVLNDPATHTYNFQTPNPATVTLDATGTINGVISGASAGADTFKWKKDSGTYTEEVEMTGAAQTLSDGVDIVFAATTGHTLVDTWTISAVLTDMPDNSDAVWVHRDKVWLNDTNEPMVAYFSKTNSANLVDSFTGSTDAGTIDLSTVLPVGDRIRAFRTYGGADSGLIAIICDKYTVIYAAGSNVYDFTFVQYFPTTCVSVNALDYMGQDLVYPARNSLTSIMSSQKNQQLEINTLSTYIENLYRSLLDAVETTTQICGVYHRRLGHYYINFPVANDHQMLVYSPDVGNFVGRWQFAVNTYSLCERVDGTILMGSDDYVYTMNDTTNQTDDGTAVQFTMSMPALYFKDANIYKKPQDFEVLIYNDGNVSLYLDYWYGLGTLASDKVTKAITITSNADFWRTAIWRTAHWRASGNNLVRTSDLLGRGKCMLMDIWHNTSGAKVTIPYFILRVINEGYN